ncbi:NAD(P)-binding protein [Testicularia cyperi]|uniref:NAD(P)-binding protein n=1 Tax=Testicularia cyperi TaxID=1882483 RepID=A0A317XT59_9BASI|nr:NAD(P)-binding protein [Testicularia cyperi]
MVANAHVQAALGRFFEASKFAVVGASKDPSKFGNKVLKWYQSHSLDITPIHPKEPEIENLKTQPDVAQFLQSANTSPEHIAISVVTPPKISLSVVQTGLQSQGVSTFWLQPGAEDADLISWVQSQPAAVQDRVVYGGPCILVSGADLARSKGKL